MVKYRYIEVVMKIAKAFKITFGAIVGVFCTFLFSSKESAEAPKDDMKAFVDALNVKPMKNPQNT